MTCPKCHSEFEATGGVCPECGVSLLRSISGVMKTSAVLIASGEDRGFYHSVQDVPEPLRTRLIQTTSSPNSGTIVIADRAGKEQLTQAMARREAARYEAAKSPENLRPGVLPSRISREQWLAWIGLVLVLLLAAGASALFYLR